MRLPFLALILSQACACAGARNMTIDDAANARYDGILDEPIILAAGEFEGRPFVEGASSRPVVRLVRDPAILTDADSDGFNEAIVLLATSFGGSGTFIHLAVVDDTGATPASVAVIELGDRVQVRSLSYEGGVITATMLEHAKEDPMCCPTVQRDRQWRWSAGVLTEIVTEPAIARVRGQVVAGHEARTLAECGGTKEIWLIDQTQGDLRALYDGLAVATYQPLFFELEGRWEDPPEAGFGADLERGFRVSGVLRAEREGFGCDLDLASFRFRASGNEPSWLMIVTDTGIRFSTMQGDSAAIAEARITERGGVFRVSASTGGSRISAEFIPERCIDPMSGSVFSYIARVSVGETHYSGCAIEGEANAN